MTTTKLKLGDRIMANVRGRCFEAIFQTRDDDGFIWVEPVSSNVSHRRLTPRQIERRVT